MHARIEPKNPGALAMAIPNPFPVVGNLTGVVTCIVSERPLGAPLIIDLWFPLHIRRRVKLADLELRSTVRAEPAYSAIHYVTRDTLNAINEIDIRFPVQGAIIYLATANIGIVNALFDEGNVVRIIIKRARSKI